MNQDQQRIAGARALLGEVTAAVKGAKAAVDRGDVIDLTGLDDIVAGLCDGIRSMPSVQGREFTPLLAELIDELARLADGMAVQRDHFLKAALDDSGRSVAGAAAAYRKNSR